MGANKNFKKREKKRKDEKRREKRKERKGKSTMILQLIYLNKVNTSINARARRLDALFCFLKGPLITNYYWLRDIRKDFRKKKY